MLTVIPIEKLNGTIKCEQHRPINMVPVYEKLLDTVVNQQFHQYVEENKLPIKYQAGFRKDHLCERALQSVITGWKNVLSVSHYVGFCFYRL
ncbi:unnamed protein product [Acanthoscelides obtectus]|uniref:Reverse transcriptase domain-containing protein n=1 Tax=Acanthoscelides obtectus TaxID=200917 RepID=A0A9P0LV54_ACAOB|nr:unnamed protein product [Acanthoscelides obtectus]CAK1635317.1 hypothetical protein AOBTE_LOCUS9199 [Acanthoscelides obtectus]